MTTDDEITVAELLARDGVHITLTDPQTGMKVEHLVERSIFQDAPVLQSFLLHMLERLGAPQ